MSEDHPILFETAKIGPVIVKNRFIMGGMHTGLEEDNNAPEKIAAFYSERAKGGVGLIITGGVSPSVDGGGQGSMAKMLSNDDISNHRIVTDAVHSKGSKIFMQILHIGGWNTPEGNFVDTYSDDDICRTIKDHAKSAELAIEAGYDGVEIIGSGTYLINQFLCSRTNLREDRWGGAFENRMRLVLEIIHQTRAAIGPDAGLSFRISLLDFIPNGSVWNETVSLAKILEQSGVDLINSTIGGHDTRIPTIAAAVPRSAFVWLSKKLKQHVDIPVTATNRINTPEHARDILRHGAADFVALARPLLADPQFVAKAKEGNDHLINTCIACNQTCLDRIFVGKVASCLVNPMACRETEFIRIGNEGKPARLAIVGAGPGGMAASIFAAEQGQKVTLFERSNEIGGQLNLAKKIPGKIEFYEMLRYFKNRISQLAIDVRLNHSPSLAELDTFDDVVIATGVSPRKIHKPWADAPNVYSYVELLNGHINVGERVAIIGTGGIGFDVAEYLCDSGEQTQSMFEGEWGIDRDLSHPSGITQNSTKTPHNEKPPSRQIFLIQRSLGKIGLRLGKTTGWIIRKHLLHRNVEMISGADCVDYSGNCLILDIQGKEQILTVDSIIVCAGQEKYDPFAETSQTHSGKQIHRIGGARNANELSAERAIREALEAVWSS